MAEQDTPPPTITAMKIPIIKKGEYDIWSIRMRQYICHTDHNLWDVIVNGDLEEEAAPSGEQFAPPAPKTAKQLAAKRNQERVKSILLLAIPDEHLLKFHNVPDAKSLWAAIKSRFGGNEESKKMQKNVLKHQFENFTTTSNESLDKAYDRFQKLISQLEVHGALVSKEDINQKFLRSLPPPWSQIALIMRNKPDIDQVDIDDLYNNLRVYEDEMKRSSSSTSNSQNLAFLSFENTSSTNEATSPPLDNEDLHQIDQDDLEELDIRQQVAMLTVRVKRFVKKTGRNLDFKGKQLVTFDKSKVECYNYQKKGHFAKECKSRRNQRKRSNDDNGKRNATINEPSSQSLMAQDGLGGYDQSNDFDVEPVNYALMAISSSSSSSSFDNEVQNCSKQCLESFKTLQKNYDSEREKHSRANLEIQGYELTLESLESRILGHEKNELAWGEKYELKNYELKCRELKIDNLKMELEKVVNERDELKVRSSDEKTTPANDRFSKADGYHVVPPPITGNFLTPRADISFASLDEYAIRKKIIESKKTKPEANTSKSKTSETIGKTNKCKKSQPKINRDKVIIEDWNLDDEDDVSEVNIVSLVKTNEIQTVKTQVDKIGQTSQKEGIGFKKIKAFFVCKSTDHLIKDCDFYAKKSLEPKLKTMVNTGQRVVKPVWDNAKRGNPEICLQDHAVVDSGCSSHMTGNKAYLLDYEDYNGGFVAFGSDTKGDELKFNLFSVSQMCDKKNSILFTDTECLILSPSFKLLDESQVVLRAPRQNDVYSLDLKNIVPSGDPLGKFDGKSDEGYLLGYSTSSKAFRVYNKRTKRVKESLHIDFLKDQPNVAGNGPDWMFDLDFLTNTMNYIPVSVENQVTVDAGIQESYIACSTGNNKETPQEYILLPLHPHGPRISVEDVVQAAQEKPSENAPKDNDVQDS
ncbi:ribonuclease H-like domain-containing protein [Tanacetum coccineum]